MKRATSVPDPFDVSVVSAVYDVARYLPELIASLEGQRGVDLSRVEVVAVDDGSTDESLQLLEQWRDRSALAVTVLTKPNGGQGSARNLGMSVARGTWVTFTDPDDTLEPSYLARVLHFLREHPQTEMVATARWVHDELTGDVTDTHPLAFMFTDDRLVDLRTTPEYFHGSAPAAFFRRTRLEAAGIRFDDRIRPNFEDGHFCSRYLLACERPLVGFVGSARYRYRKRADSSSTLNTSVEQPERYTVVPRAGYLDLLERSAASSGTPEPWVQELVLYELSWYFSAEATIAGRRTAAVGAVAAEFLRTLREISDHLDRQRVEQFSARAYRSAWRDILLHGVHGDDWHAGYAVVGKRDRQQRLMRVVTRFTGTEPVVDYLVKGQKTEPLHSKVMSFRYFDHDLLHQRVSWLPLTTHLEVRVGGQVLPQRATWPTPSKPTTPSGSRWRRLLQDPADTLGRARAKVVRKAVRSQPLAGPFRDAWVLMDRVHDADDSGEHLFHHLREHRTDVNAWFVLERGTPDWHRLAPLLGPRLVAYGSRRWVRLMLNAHVVASSHVDAPMHRPPQVMKLLRGRRPNWRFAFLQHGVIKDDLSAWLNPKGLDLFVTSTPGEQASVVADGTTYTYTTRESQLLGLPRFDRLLAAAERIPDGKRDLVLVAPTWRQWLTSGLAPGSQRRTVRDDFLTTEYAEQWLGLLASPRLAELCAAHGLRVGFLPHPNLQSVLPSLELPPHVEPLAFVGNDLQELFARAAVLVTDYSSMAFNAAYLDRPVVYFQFDAEAVAQGAHVGRAGYFRYERDGFGPVVQTLDDAVTAIEGVAADGFVPDLEYRRRNEQAFVLRDGRCCERVTAAIEALSQPAVRGGRG